MDDLISREAAIDVAKKCPVKEVTPAYMLINKAEVMTELMMLPSAQPEREKGNWVYGEDEYGIDGYHCDKCGFFVPWDYGHTFINYIEDYHFCPSCGADMRGEQGE